MSFKTDVERIDGLVGSYQSGLQALNSDARASLTLKRPKNVVGSVDIDNSLRPLQPTANRWDYLVGYKHGDSVVLYFIELHPASSASEIHKIVRKAAWLKDWLRGTSLQSHTRHLYWVATGRICFNLRDPKLKALALEGVSFAGKHLQIGA